MYLNYKNSKVTIADYDPDYGPNGADPKEFLVTNLQITVDAQVNATYEIGNRYSTTFIPEGGINGSLSISYPITGKDPLLDYIINDSGSLPHYRTLSGNFGGLNFSSGYLQSYNLNIAPNSVISANASLVFFDALSGLHQPASDSSPNLDAVDTLVFNANDVILKSYEVGEGSEIKTNLSNIKSINYSYNGTIEPNYEIGQTIPKEVVFGPKFATCNLQFDSLSGDMPVYGKRGDLLLYMTHPLIKGLVEEIRISGDINQRNISSNAGSVITSNISIQQAEFISTVPHVSVVPTDAKNWGDEVSFLGNNLTDLTAVKIGDIPVEVYKITNPRLLKIEVPGGAVTGPLKVYYDVRGSVISQNQNLVITDPGLSVTGYYLKDGLTESYTGAMGEEMVIKGQYFDGVDEVYFVKDSGPQGSKDHTHVKTSFEITSRGSDSQIMAKIPTDCMSGHIVLKSSTRNVTNTNNARISERMFVPAPQIDSVSFSDSSRPNGIITLSGKGFSSLHEHLDGAGSLTFGTGSVNNLSLSPLSGALSSGYEILTESGERLGNNTIRMGAPKLSAGYSLGRIKINGASGVSAIAPIEYDPVVFITGINGNISKSDLTLTNLASGDIDSNIQITGGNFYSELLFRVDANNDNAANAYAVDYNGFTGIVYPDATNPYTVLTGVVPKAARSGTLSILSNDGGIHESGMQFSVVYPAPDIRSVFPSSGVAGDILTLSGYYFEGVTGLKLIKRSTTKASDEIISGVLQPRISINTVTENLSSNKDYKVILGGVSGFNSNLNINFDANHNSPDLISFAIPSGFRGGAASAGTAGTAGTSFGEYIKTNFLFSGHGIFDIVLEADRGGYVVSGASTSGLVVMSEPKPSGCYVNTAPIDSVHYNDFVNRAVTGVPGDEVFISGENLYPGSLIYLNDYTSSSAQGISTEAYPSDLYDDHIHSGQYTGLSFTIPSFTGVTGIALVDTGIKIYVKNKRGVSEIKSFYNKNWISDSNIETKPNDLFVFLEPQISGFEPGIVNEGDTVTVSGSFLTGISSVRIGNYDLDFENNYVKSKNSSLQSDWLSASREQNSIHETIYGTSFSFQMPTGIQEGQISVTATGGLVESDSTLRLFDALPVIDGFTPSAIGYNRTIYLSGTNLENISNVYLSGVSQEYLEEVNSPFHQEGEIFSSSYYEEVECNFFNLDSNNTGISILCPNNLAKSGYIKIKTNDGSIVFSEDKLFLTKITKISPELSFLNDSKIEIQGINLNYPGIDVRFRGVSNPKSLEENLSEDFRFIKGSGNVDTSNVSANVKFVGSNYGTDATWGATGAYIYPNREIIADSIYLTSGKEPNQTKANGPHEDFFTNSFGMVLDKSQQTFIPQPEISGVMRELIPGAGKTYTHGEKMTGLSPNTYFFMTGINCHDVSKNLVGSFTIKDWGEYTSDSSVNFDALIISKYLTKELSGFHSNIPNQYYPFQGASYTDVITGSLSGTLTGASISDFDQGYVILSGKIGEGISGSIGIPSNKSNTNILYTLCSVYDNNCVFEEDLNSPLGGLLNERDCSHKDDADDLSKIKSAEDRINKFLISRDCS